MDDVMPLIRLLGTKDIRALAEKLRLQAWRGQCCLYDRLPPLTDDAKLALKGGIDPIALTAADVVLEYHAALTKFEHLAREQLTGESDESAELLRAWPTEHENWRLES
jgi:hypothetical protein